PPLYSPDLHTPACFAPVPCPKLADHLRLKQARVVVGGRGALAAPSAGTISSPGAVSPCWIRSRASTFFILVEPSHLGIYRCCLYTVSI
ncbi:Os02g0696650, partial [Oryza sativa Japonica Group]